MSSITKTLQSNLKFNPFHEGFDTTAIASFLKSIDQEQMDFDIIQKVLCLPIFNEHFKELTDYCEESFKQSNLSKDTFIQLLIIFANRDVYLVKQRSAETYKEKNEFTYEELTNHSIESPLGNFNVQGGLEASTDGLNSLLNIIRKFDSDSTNKIPTAENINTIFGILRASNLFAVLKASFELSIWEGYLMQYQIDEEILRIKNPPESYQIYNRIGEFRLERNVFSSKTYIMSSRWENPDYYNSMEDIFRKKRKTKRLKSVSILNGQLKYKLGSGIDKESILLDLLGFAEITTYYSFISNETLPNLDNLQLFDLLTIFSEIQHLFSAAFNFSKSEDEFESAIVHKVYDLQLTKEEVIDYILQKTIYTRSQIISFLKLLCHTESYYDVWQKPLIQIGKNIYPVQLPLLSAIKLRMVDNWLENGGFDIDARGELFEKHIRDTLGFYISKKGYYVKVYNESNFTATNGKTEEIDLIIELKNINIIAEVKCIKYPFGSRDYHNMSKRLVAAGKQLERKTNFLMSNKKDFANINFSKPFVKIIITNYPFFSGHKINDIPIADFSLIENYFVNGKFNRGRVVQTRDKIKVDDKFKNLAIYYSTEDEFCNNVATFFNNPTPIVDKFDDILVEEKAITFEGFIPKICVDYLIFKDSINI